MQLGCIHLDNAQICKVNLRVVVHVIPLTCFSFLNPIIDPSCAILNPLEIRFDTSFLHRERHLFCKFKVTPEMCAFRNWTICQDDVPQATTSLSASLK